MSRNRKSNRKHRSFHIESLERRELMSAAPWSTTVGQSPLGSGELVEVVASATPQASTSASSLSSTAILRDPAPIPIKVVNDGPYYGSYGRPLQISVASLLANDTGANFRIVEGSFKSSEGGIVEIRNGMVTYYHPQDAAHKDSFEYKVQYEKKDSRSDAFNPGPAKWVTVTASAKVSVVVEDIPPIANNDVNGDLFQQHFYKNQVTKFDATQLLWNDKDADGSRHVLKVISVKATAETHGTVVKVGNWIYFTPADDYVGAASFEYTIEDPDGLRDSARMEFKVTNVDHVVGTPKPGDDDGTDDGDTPSESPIAVADGHTVETGKTVAISVLNNDRDPQSDPMKVVHCYKPLHGTLTTIGSLANGQFKFTPDAGYVGATSFNYVVEDSKGNRSTGTVTIDVTPLPVAIENSFGHWEVIGTEGDDRVQITKKGENVYISRGGATKWIGGIRNIKSITFGGGAGNDVFQNDTDIKSIVYGGEGNDTLIGGGGKDALYGQGGEDILRGRGGDDELDGGLGNDKLNGGDGNDKMVAKDGKHGNDIVDGGAGSNAILDDPAPDPVPAAKLVNRRLVIQGSSNADNVSVSLVGGQIEVNFNGKLKYFTAASIRAIEFNGGLGDDKFTNNTSIATEASGGDGNDILIGGAGNDVLRGGAGNDRLEGRGGNDVLHGDNAQDTILGGNGDDLLFGGNHNDHLDGGAGSDRLEGGSGDDRIYGGDGRDFLFGQDGNDWMYGGFGDDDLYGGLGADRIQGDAGNDKLYGGKGADILRGNDGADHLDGEDDNDELYGDQGNDRLVSRDSIVGNDKLSDRFGKNLFEAPQVEIM